MEQQEAADIWQFKLQNSLNDKVYGVCSKEKVDIIKNLNVCEDVLAYNAVDFVYTLDRVLLSEAGKPKLD